MRNQFNYKKNSQSDVFVTITSKVKREIDKADVSKMPKNVDVVDADAIPAVKRLSAYLFSLSENRQVLFGHQNSTFKSVFDWGVTSDIKSITGSEAGVFGIDSLALAGDEVGEKTRQGAINASIEASRKAYSGGSIITLSCHMPNFANPKITYTGNANYPYDFTNCCFFESKDLTASAENILEGGQYNDRFNAYLDIIADFALILQDDNIPVLFRPFHENNGGWFWWGNVTAVETFRAMWRYVFNYMKKKGVHNFLYVYSPNGPIESEDHYYERYPGDEYVDVVAFDYYDDYEDTTKYTGDRFFEILDKSCKIIKGIADERNKVAIIAETGIRIIGAGKDSLMVSGNPTLGHDWYNKVIETASNNNIPYVLLWGNFAGDNFFVPYKYNNHMGQEMINDFIDAYNNEKSIFGNGTNFYDAL